MSDFVQGALIAGAFAVVGSLVTALITYCNTKRQLRGTLQQLSLRMEHDAKEKRRDRSIEARKTYLVPLRELISQWNIKLMEMTSSLALLEQEFESENKKQSITETQAYKKHQALNQRMYSMAESHESFYGQISDKKLLELVNEAGEIQQENIEKRMAMYRSIDIKDLKKLSEVIKKNREDDAIVKEKLLNINKRIEELLCGDETK